MRHHAQRLEGLFDTNVTPNDRYNDSSVLFWAMIYVGSQRYSQDPTICK